VVLDFQPEGFPAGLIGPGTKVIGFVPMRLLCILLNVRQPRRLSKEDRVPTVDELQSAWQDEIANSRNEAYQCRADWALGASNRNAIVTVASQLYGEEWLP
jgi:hypothetical protein